MNTEETWTRFRELVDPGSGDPLSAKALALRNELAVHYMPLAENVAKKQRTNLPNHIELGDLQQWANLGLLEAIKNFDPVRGVPFEAYAVRRINGKIIDALRTDDWAPRGLRSQQRNVNKAVDKLQTILDREPTDEEIAKYLEVRVSEVVSTRQKAEKANHAYIEENTEAANSFDGDIEADYEMQGYRDIFVSAVRTLPFQQQVIIALRYYLNKNLTDIGKMLHFGDVRVGLLHKEAVLKIWREMQRNLELV